MRWSELKREKCSVARTVSVIGDRWTLLILRDCFLRVRRFEEFERRLGITRHVLADRLKKLVTSGVLERRLYQAQPRRFEYRLTPKGLDLHSVLLSIAHWGDRHMAGAKGPPVLYRHRACDHDFAPVLTCSECGERVEARTVTVQRGPGGSRDERIADATGPRLAGASG
jgi:DNA-binding HxlR family transcriptional regulator